MQLLLAEDERSLARAIAHILEKTAAAPILSLMGKPP